MLEKADQFASKTAAELNKPANASVAGPRGACPAND
jgi:hypothetical protein